MAAFVASERMGWDEKGQRFYPEGLCHGVEAGDDTTLCVLPLNGIKTQLKPWIDRSWAMLETNAVVTRCSDCDTARP